MALVCICVLLLQSAHVYTTLILTEVRGIFEILTASNSTYFFTAIVPKLAIKAQVKPVLSKNETLLMRHQSLKSRCHRLYGENHRFLTDANFHRGHLIYNDKYKLVYCYIPKIACTNLQRVFGILSGKVKHTDPLKIPHAQVHGVVHNVYLSYLSNSKNNQSEVMHRLKNYKKIIFVREPFERLLSAWRNKFGPTGEATFKYGIGRQIARRYRRNVSVASHTKGYDVTFNEFIRYLIDLNDKRGSFNEHWQKYTELCHPCKVGYDFIGNFETMEEDMDYLLKDIGVSDFIRFPRRNETHRNDKTIDVLTKFYKEIPKKHIKRIMDIYASDSFLFDLKVPTAIHKLLEED